MPLHFEADEMAARRERACASLKAAGLDALLMFKQESMYWLSGYDTFGFALFQCLVLTADGRVALLTRAPDLGTARYTSNIEDVRIWADVEGVDPAAELGSLLGEMGLRGASVGIELDSYGLKAANWQALEAVMSGFCRWTDTSSLIQELRRTKSPQEIAYHRRAAELADMAWDEAVALCAPGASEAEILAAMQGTMLREGGDYAGNEIIIGSGDGALMVRYTSGRRQMSANDQLTLEWAGVEKRYHAAMMRTALVGKVNPVQVAMHSACVDALLAAEGAIRAGVSMGSVFDAHASVLDDAGFKAHRMHVGGYGMGAVYAPIWVDWPMLYHGNPLTLGANQVLFLHMILLDAPNQLAMTLGHSVLVKANGCERLSRSSLDLVTT